MTLEACYQELGGNFTEVSARLPSARLVERFTCRFPEDGSFEALCREMEAGNREEAFRASHTLKGVCANLSFTRLLGSVSALTEVLRGAGEGIPEAAPALLEQVRRDYQTTVDAIVRYRAER